LEVLSQRDRNGLFEGAKKGDIANVAGINAPYEEPMKPEVLCNTDQEPPEKSLQSLVKTLEILGYLGQRGTGAYSAEEEALIKDRLKDLGYI
jgi:adenylylsulfate kinase